MWLPKRHQSATRNGAKMKLRGLFTALMIVAAGIAGGYATAAPAAPPPATIATLAGVDYRAAVVARHSSGEEPANARVVVTLYGRTQRGWALAFQRRLPETYFWRTVTAPHAICRLALSTASGRTGGGQLVVQ